MSSVGKVSTCLNKWQELTSDTWILQTVSGYHIEFFHQPFQEFLPKLPNWSVEQSECISKEIDNLLQKGAIVQVVPEQGQFLSNLFLVQKKNGDWRPVINLRKLNKFIKYFHFKMETIETVKKMLNKNDFLCSLDLTDAYFAISVEKCDRKFLRFQWNNNLYEFVCLCFGIKTAPRVFTKMLKVPISHLRLLGIRISSYIDDSIIAGEDESSCSNNVQCTRNLLESLGFTINVKKSNLKPSRQIVYLGFLWDTELMTLSLPPDKIDKILSVSILVLSKESISVRKLASLIGLFVSAFPAVFLGKFYYRQLEREKINALRIHNSFEASVSLTQDSKEEIQWWIDNIQSHNGSPIKLPSIHSTIFTDASNSGWGAWCGEKLVHGFWSETETLEHINFLELKAIWLALLAFASSLRDVHLAVKCDNSTAVAYINNLGGIKSKKVE